MSDPMEAADGLPDAGRPMTDLAATADGLPDAGRPMTDLATTAEDPPDARQPMSGPEETADGRPEGGQPAAGFATGSLDVAWLHGRRGEPLIQTHVYDERTVILRQSKRVEYEAPFLYLLFGDDRALLLDTGASADPALFPLRATVDELVDGWLEKHPRDGYELVVAHSHGHGDHVAADAQFDGRPATTVVPHGEQAVREFFGFPGRLTGSVRFDLGGRVLEILGSPGHHEAAITVYDPWTGFLLTGDTVYPGRLYVADYPAFRETLESMVAFAATHPVSHVLGCHIEMTRRPGRDYPLGARFQPEEHVLQLTVGQLTEVRDATVRAEGRPGVHRHPDFILYIDPGKKEKRHLLVRAKLRRLQEALLRP